MTDLAQLSKDLTNRISNDLKQDSEAKTILQKYAKKYPGESLGILLLTVFSQEEIDEVLPFFMKSVDPIVKEFMAEEKLI